MSTNFHSSDHGANGALQGQSYFQTQRAALVSEIAVALDSTLTHLNRLNRSLESVIGIGNEFSNVEALWSQFEGVMGKNPNDLAGSAGEGTKEGAETGTGAEEESRDTTLDTPPVARTR